MEKYKIKDCVYCKEKQCVIQICYGRPSQGLIDDANQGKVYLGGCIIKEDAPDFYCKKCLKKYKEGMLEKNCLFL